MAATGAVPRLLLRSWRWAAGLAAVNGIVAVTSLALPGAVADAVDSVLAGPAGSVGPATRTVAVLAVLDALALAASGLLAGRATAALTAELRRELGARVFAEDGTGARAPGDEVSRLVSDAEQAAELLPALVSTVLATLAAVAGLALLGALDPWSAFAFGLTAAPGAVLVRRLLPRFSQAYADYQSRLGELSARLAEALAGRRTIRAAGTLPAEARRVLAPLPGLRAAGDATWRAQRALSWQLFLLRGVVDFAVLATAGLGVASGRLSTGTSWPRWGTRRWRPGC